MEHFCHWSAPWNIFYKFVEGIMVVCKEVDSRLVTLASSSLNIVGDTAGFVSPWICPCISCWYHPIYLQYTTNRITFEWNSLNSPSDSLDVSCHKILSKPCSIPYIFSRLAWQPRPWLANANLMHILKPGDRSLQQV